MGKLYCNIKYYHEKPIEVETNIRPELVEDFILDQVIRGQSGQGADHSKFKIQDCYHIKITCDLSYDSITISSDTGNKGLTAGMIMDAFNRGAFKPSALERKTDEDGLKEIYGPQCLH